MDRKEKLPSVAIIGSGISGLSTAHELAERGYQVSVYEKLSEPGGVARSFRQNPSSTPSEYSWRGFGPFYHNVFDLMKRIPEKDKTVYDSLTRPIHFIFTKNRGGLTGELSFRDNLILGITILKVAFAGEKRTNYYASVNASDYMKERMSHRGWKQFISMIGPWVGIDPQRASLYHTIYFIVIHFLPNDRPPYSHSDEKGEWKMGIMDWSVTNKPTSEAWFEPWVDYLESLGVKFYFNSPLKSISLEENKIDCVVVENNGNDCSIKADYYVMAISPFGMKTVLGNSLFNNSEVLSDLKNQFVNLTQDGPHNQVSFRIGFNKKANWSDDDRPVILSDSEFNITMYDQDKWWNGVELGDDISTLWSGTACIGYSPGKLFRKPVTDLTEEEFEKEILNQLSKDKGFNEMLKEFSNETFPEMKKNIIHFEVWKSWKFSKPLTTMEPKYVDSTNTRKYQPSVISPFSNMFFAGGHTQTTTNIWSMEAAAEAGRRAADMITGEESTFDHDKGPILNTVGKIDDFLYDCNLPGIMETIIIFVIVMMILLVVWNKKMIF